MDLLALAASAALYLGYAVQILGALLTIALIVPGDQPDRFLQGALDLLKKLSIK